MFPWEKPAPKAHPWKKGIDKGSSLYKVSPVVDSRGILRVGGRLSECIDISDELRNPIIIPGNHRGTYLLMQEYHERYMHAITAR